MLETLLDRAGRIFFSGRIKLPHGCKLVNFENVAKVAAFVAIQSVMKMVARVTSLESGICDDIY